MFITIAIGTFISVVDHGSVLIALPVLQSHFGVELSSVQWVVVGYGLTISALLLPMGRLGDYFGKNRIYMLGMFIFAVASMLAIFSPNLTAVIICKILQGIGSAMVQANAIAIIISTFSSSERGKALGSHLTRLRRITDKFIRLEIRVFGKCTSRHLGNIGSHHGVRDSSIRQNRF